MTNYEDIRGTLPYKESPVYIEGLIDRCKEGALVAAIVTLAITLAPRKAPIDRFLANISDEEAEMIVDYDIEDISYPIFNE